MIRLQVQWDDPAIADGLYTIHAAGALMAGLWWADENGPLPDWTVFAFVPIDPSGRGVFSDIPAAGRCPGRPPTFLSAPPRPA